MSDNENQRREKIQRWLEAEGFRPRLDDDGDLLFDFEGGHYCILSRSSDAEFVHLIYPNFWSIESEEERVRAIQAAHDATRDTKVAKIYVHGDAVHAAVETFHMDVGGFNQTLMRSLSAIRTARGKFTSAMVGSGEADVLESLRERLTELAGTK